MLLLSLPPAPVVTASATLSGSGTDDASLTTLTGGIAASATLYTGGAATSVTLPGGTDAASPATLAA